MMTDRGILNIGPSIKGNIQK